MTGDRNEPLAQLKARRDMALGALVNGMPYAAWLGIRFDRRGEELTATLPFAERLIGNPMLPALHGGATAAFLETTAIVELTWAAMWGDLEAGRVAPDPERPETLPRLPKTIDFTIDYLRQARAEDLYAEAEVQRVGRRVANVRMRAFQREREQPVVLGRGNFLLG